MPRGALFGDPWSPHAFRCPHVGLCPNSKEARRTFPKVLPAFIEHRPPQSKVDPYPTFAVRPDPTTMRALQSLDGPLPKACLEPRVHSHALHRVRARSNLRRPGSNEAPTPLQTPVDQTDPAEPPPAGHRALVRSSREGCASRATSCRLRCVVRWPTPIPARPPSATLRR